MGKCTPSSEQTDRGDPPRDPRPQVRREHRSWGRNGRECLHPHPPAPGGEWLTVPTAEWWHRPHSWGKTSLRAVGTQSMRQMPSGVQTHEVCKQANMGPWAQHAGEAPQACQCLGRWQCLQEVWCGPGAWAGTVGQLPGAQVSEQHESLHGDILDAPAVAARQPRHLQEPKLSTEIRIWKPAWSAVGKAGKRGRCGSDAGAASRTQRRL